MRRFNLSDWAVHHQALVLFFIVGLALAGLFSYQRLGRSEDPSFTIKLAVVSILWPGATAQEMQSQVAEPMEKKLQELPYFDKVQTYSKPGFAAMQVFFKDSTPPKEVPYLFYLTRKKLVDMQGELPQGVIGPIINDEYGDVDSILYMLTGDGADYAQLKKIADALRQKTLEGTERHQGQPLRRAGPEDLRRIFACEARDARRHAASVVRFACQAECGCPRWRRRDLVATCCSARDRVRSTAPRAVAETPVEANGRVFRLGDIATVTRGFEDPSDYVVRQRGKPAIGVGVVMAKGGNLLQLGEDVKKSTDEFMATVPRRRSRSSRSPTSRRWSSTPSRSSSARSSRRSRSCWR